MPFKSQNQLIWMKINKPEMYKKWREETPKGTKLPKKVKKEQGGSISEMGYRDISPYKNADFLDINTPTGEITMKGVSTPLIGQDNLGFQQLMLPNQEYKFKGNKVREIPFKFQEGGRLVKEVPQGYIPLDGKPNYYHNPQSSLELKSAQSSNTKGGIEYEQFLKDAATKYPIDELIKKGYGTADGLKKYQGLYKASDDIVYTQPTTQTTPAYAGRGQAIYLPNKHIAGELYYNTRDSKSVTDGGTLNTAPQSAHIKFRNDFGYDGNEVDIEGADLQKYLGTSHTFPTTDLYNQLISRGTAKTQSKLQIGGYSTVNQHPINTNLNNVIAPNLTGLQRSLDFSPLQPKVPQDRDLSYLPLFTNSIAQALAKRTEFSRQNEYQQSNLANPLNFLPNITQSNSYSNYGTPVFEEGGMTGDYEDMQDEDFLFEQDTPEFEQQVPVEEFIAQLPQEEEQPVIQIDDLENSIEAPENSAFTRNANGLINPLSSSKYANTTPTKGEDKAYDYLVNTKGLQPHIASGIVGNLIEESGLNTSAIGDSGLARGIAQWHPDRQKGLNSFAATQGKNPSDFYTQLDYVVEEAKQRGDLSKISQAKSPTEAANLFAKHYERPKIISNSRLANAERIFKKFNK